MLYKFVAAAAIATAIVGGPSVSQAQDDPGIEMEMINWHIYYYLPHAPQQACVRFGVLLGQHTDKWPEWRQTRPEWFDWEKNKSP
jgi:hypothetical protein